MWAVHGVRVPQRVVERPETLSPQEILAEPNVEIRRVMLDRFGVDRLMREAEAEMLDQDVDQYGRLRELLRLPMVDDEDVVMVHVTNSTAEPDGSFKPYWLRVPPDTTTCADAVAWTWDLSVAEYGTPLVET